MSLAAIHILHAEIGTVSSRPDGSAAFRVLTPELRAAEAGALMGWHGKTCSVLVKPQADPADELIEVQAERGDKRTPSQRLRSALFVLWKARNEGGEFAPFYNAKMNQLIDLVTSKIQ